MLDALYQWTNTPTGITAIRKGYRPSHDLIKGNLRIRYNLNFEEAEKIFGKFKEEVEAAGLDFSIGFNEVYNKVNEYFNKNNILKETTIQKLKTAPEEEKYIIWLWCLDKRKDNFNLPGGIYGYKPQDRNHLQGIISFQAILNATFNITIDQTEIFSTLIKLGFLNELHWTSSKGNNRGNIFVFPHYLEVLGEKLDEYIQYPDLPDFRKYIDELLHKKQSETLIAFEELLEKWLISEKEITGKIIPISYILGKAGGKSGDTYAINFRIHKLLSDYFFERKKNGVLKLESKVTRVVRELYERFYPDLLPASDEVLFNCTRAWKLSARNKSLSERDFLIILAPWLTGPQLRQLREEAKKKYVLILTTIMGIPELDFVYRKFFLKGISEETDLNLIIIDYTRDTILVEVFGEKPAIYEEFMKAMKTMRETDITEGEKGQNPLSIPQPSLPVPPPYLSMFLGGSREGKEIFWSPGKLNNGHFIIIGGSGAGKTETIRTITSELNKKKFPVLLIDFHGDMACESSEVKNYTIKPGREYYFNPLELDPKFEEITPLRAISDFINAIAINFPSLGVQQQHHLKEIIKRAYKRSGITDKKETWFKQLEFIDIENEIKNSDDKITQTINAYLSDIFDYGLFSGSEKISIADILSGGVSCVNLKPLPEGVRSLYADLLLRKLYYSLQALGEIPRGDTSDRKKFRLFVIVDEAKLLLREDQGIKAVLNKYATELRKYGAGLILASQLIDHFPDEILSNISVKLCMKTENKQQAKKNSKFFGVNEVDLIDFQKGEGILIIGNERVNIKIMPTWERIKELDLSPACA